MSYSRNNAEDICLTHHTASCQTPPLPYEDIPRSKVAQNYDEKASTSTDESSENDVDAPFPEGGPRAWLVVLGCFCGQFSVFGIINSTAVFQEYFSTHQLKDYSPGQIGWIFSLGLFLTFFGGLPIGPIFDARGPRLLIFCGSVLLIASVMLLGICTRTKPPPPSPNPSGDLFFTTLWPI